MMNFFFGTDAIMNTQYAAFWNQWSQIMPGAVVNESLWDGTNPDFNPNDFTISFRANLFIQYKIPQFLSQTNSAEYQNWFQPYFRYKLRDHQQKVLSRLESNLSDDDALVIYACPVCSKFAELQDFAMRHRIVENSNFVHSSDLTNHTRYTFISGGTDGQAFQTKGH